MDYIITYKFKQGTDKKIKSKVSSILKNTYEKKNLLIRLGYGRLFIDTKFICYEIKEKLENNNAIVKIEELEELSDSIKQLLEGKFQDKELELKFEAIKKSLLYYDELFKKIVVSSTMREVESHISTVDSNIIEQGLKIAKEGTA